MDIEERFVRRQGWGPFSGRQLTTMVCVAIVSIVAIPTAAIAAVGVFTSSTATPAVSGTNSSADSNATGVLGAATGTGGAARLGVVGTATGKSGIGVKGGGTKYGVFSNGPLGVAAGNELVCDRCVTGADIANRKVVHYDLAPNASTAPITIPAGVPVQIMGMQTVDEFRGIATATMVRKADTYLEWIGIGSDVHLVGSDGSAPGTHILYLDSANLVDLEVSSANAFLVHNGNAGTRMTGTVTITW